jgi:putative transposase
MKRLQAFKFELRPNGMQQRQMRRFAGACRFVYNKALALQKARFDAGQKQLSYAGVCRLLTVWRNGMETLWLKDAPTHPLQQALKDLERAYSNFFAKRADLPRFKKKGKQDSFRYPDRKQFRLDQANSRIFLPKLGWLRYRNSRMVPGTVKNLTVSLSGGKWLVSIQTEREVEQPLSQGGAVGIDLGVARFATLSDGTFYVPLNSFKRHESALRKRQQAMSRKQKFSHNWSKAKASIQRIHARIGNARRDYLHKISTTISQNHAMVCLEDLQVRNMSKSAAGSIQMPGKQVRAKSGLNKAILDRDGSSSAANWITSCPGAVAISSSCRRRTPAESVRCAIWYRRRTARGKPTSPASPAVSRNTPTGSAPSTFSGRDTPIAPVK